MEGKELREVQDLNYLSSHIACTESDIRARIGKAWKGLNDMKKMWRSNMSGAKNRHSSKPLYNLFFFMVVKPETSPSHKIVVILACCKWP